jgi:hypothetical protein
MSTVHSGKPVAVKGAEVSIKCAVYKHICVLGCKEA